MTTIKRFTPDYKMHAVRFEAFAREAEHGEYVRFDAHQQTVGALEAERDAQQKRADALAVENQALKDAITTHSQSTHFCELCGKDYSCNTDDVCYALNEIPATSAALAAIRNEATERALKHLRDCQIISATVAELKADELREAK
ncbi:Uncharacterised protein [Serratia marcescens]|uniref:hypothetical protein n=1 Tax=Serratia marcescens TaxID=615 RepID=UPI0007453EBA|nr:hypothetical protein [Serratia marcescens]CUY11912.1 Uncharacterised protein [Serratia marcescens]CUY64388.1 Uncharacterised protein [Serratia marcescens]CUZ29972.1 Uncharacterised protein [Serratia marcescens]CVG47420.1 Uncharacterised protein [Serratia marcescens]